MAYPESADVSPGDPTLSAHYNNLRADALFAGFDSGDCVALASMLERYETRLTLEKLNTAQVRVVASATAPVSLIIDGYQCQAVSNVILDLGDVPPGGASGTYYVFANRADDSSTFTLSISTSITEAADQRLIGRFYWDGTNINKDSVRTELALYIADIMYFTDPHICDGRLTLSTGVPVPTSSISASSNIYFTPYTGNRISLYVNDYGWRVYTFSELTLDISAVAVDKNVDVWIYDNNGTLTLAYTEWSNDTLRATNIVRQDGVLVKSGAPEYRYLGTARTAASGEIADTTTERFLWNFYHRVDRRMLKTVGVGSWTYATANTWRALNNSNNNRVEFVIGVSEDPVKLDAHVLAENSGNNSIGIGIDLDGTTANDAQLNKGIKSVNTPDNIGWYGAFYLKEVAVGYHFLQMTEVNGGGTSTYYGDRGCANGEILSGCIGYVTG